MTDRIRRAVCAAGLVALLSDSGCGGGNPAGPVPTTPTPTPTPAGVPGGTVRGRYVFRIDLAASCQAPLRSLSYNVEAEPDDTPRYPGVQVALEVVELLEMELQYLTPTLRGSVGTTHDGVAPLESTLASPVYLFMHAIAVGDVRTERGAGEVLQGTLTGDLAFGRHALDAGGLGSCSSGVHQWSLRLR
jgi:hypothetical protein